MHTGTALLPLHGGKTPKWLFNRMKLLAREILQVLVIEKGPEEILKRLSDPYWFQALGCVLGFDWHSSGLTTTTCGAVKEALVPITDDVGVFAAGGKGASSRKTPSEIQTYSEKHGLQAAPLVYASKMSAKVDSSAVQDGYQLYHHFFVFLRNGTWCVVQQGMNEINRYARRYHWHSDAMEDFVDEPHQAICAQAKATTLNLVAHESLPNRQTSAQLACEHPDKMTKTLERAQELDLPLRHDITLRDIHPARMHKIFVSTYERQPQTFEELVGLPGVGAKSLRAYSLISELVYGQKPSYQDPARFSFAHGGKDGIPFPVDRKQYDESIQFMRQVVDAAKMSDKDKLGAFRRLAWWEKAQQSGHRSISC